MAKQAYVALAAAYNALFMVYTYLSFLSAGDWRALLAIYLLLALYYLAGRALLSSLGGPDELKRRSWLLGLAAALVLSALSLPLALELALAPPARFAALVSTDSPTSRAALLFFSAEMVLDLAIGAVDYPAQVHELSGLAHHTAFLLGSWMTLRHGACGFFLGGALVEVPTLLLAVGSVHRPWRADVAYALSFFLFRVAYALWYTARLALFSGLPAFAAMMAASCCLNLVWFYSTVVALGRRLGAKAPPA